MLKPLEEKILSAWLNHRDIVITTQSGNTFTGEMAGFDGCGIVHINIGEDKPQIIGFANIVDITEVPPEPDAKTKAAIPELIEAAKDLINSMVSAPDSICVDLMPLAKALMKIGIKNALVRE